ENKSLGQVQSNGNKSLGQVQSNGNKSLGQGQSNGNKSLGQGHFLFFFNQITIFFPFQKLSWIIFG
ncbi:MAG: hypothetical protein Q8838_02250, partial [Candidatus Phytoplasma australasiaticum]|nr:hypothetical protein [Candidatus Phytoplasma australasiaticum]